MLLESSMQSVTPLLRQTDVPLTTAASAAAANAAGSSSAATRIKAEPTCNSHAPGPSKLTTTQRGELELARQRAVRAAAGRKPAHAAAHTTKRQRDSAYHSHGHKDMDFLGSDDGMDSDTDISKLSAEEQERVIAARLAETDNEKDARRLKRLLRNRVSAQQARERKKHYVTCLEDRAKAAEVDIAELEARIAELEAQNCGLRNIIHSMRPPGSFPAGVELAPESSRTAGAPAGRAAQRRVIAAQGGHAAEDSGLEERQVPGNDAG
ncbi:MAG: hypothetical protein WDW36_009383 [Sanguina aurantia]